MVAPWQLDDAKPFGGLALVRAGAIAAKQELADVLGYRVAALEPPGEVFADDVALEDA